jgi:hypothetical protein
MKHPLVYLLAFTAISAAPSRQTFTGIISDDMCWKAGHARMGMGSNDAECTKACVAEHGASYVLKAGANVYTLSDQKTPEQFAAQKTKIVGVLDSKTKTIQVESISRAK